MTDTDDWSDGPNPSPERQAFHAPAVDIRDIGGTVTDTDDLLPWQKPRPYEGVGQIHASCDAHVAALEAEVERLQAENDDLQTQLALDAMPEGP